MRTLFLLVNVIVHFLCIDLYISCPAACTILSGFLLLLLLWIKFQLSERGCLDAVIGGGMLLLLYCWNVDLHEFFWHNYNVILVYTSLLFFVNDGQSKPKLNLSRWGTFGMFSVFIMFNVNNLFILQHLILMSLRKKERPQWGLSRRQHSVPPINSGILLQRKVLQPRSTLTKAQSSWMCTEW